MTEQLSKWFLRFAITPDCNFRCTYCNPAALKATGEVVNEDDIERIISAAHDAGVNRVHWTGGEPTQKDIKRLVKAAKDIGYVEQVMTTNGSKGGKLISDLAERGLSRLIVSLDTLDPARFKEITRTRHYVDVLDTIERAVCELATPTKMNVVYMQETKAEIPALIEYGKRINELPFKKGSLVVKFIEMSQNNPVFHQEQGKDLYANSHSTRDGLFGELAKFGSMERVKVKGNNPNTEYYDVPALGMTVGLITIPSLGYKCGGDSCTKIRMNPYGAAAVCITQPPVMLLEDMSHDAMVEKFKDLMVSRATLRPDRKHFKGDFGYWRFGSCGTDEKK